MTTFLSFTVHGANHATIQRDAFDKIRDFLGYDVWADDSDKHPQVTFTVRPVSTNGTGHITLWSADVNVRWQR